MNNIRYAVRIEMGGKQIELTEPSFEGLQTNVQHLAAILCDCNTVEEFSIRWHSALEEAADGRPA